MTIEVRATKDSSAMTAAAVTGLSAAGVAFQMRAARIRSSPIAATHHKAG
jgi:hypothetical protein